MKAASKLDQKYWKFIILFGLFEASWAVIWGAYNNYFPIILQSGGEGFDMLGVSNALGFGIGAFLTGVIMTLDNFFGMVFTPLWGAMTDLAKSRKKILVISGTLASILVAILPLCYSTITPEKSGHIEKLVLTFTLCIVVSFFMILFWSISLSARGGFAYSTVPSKLYNKMSSFIMLFGGIGYLVSMFTSGMLYKIHYALPYWLGAAILFITMLLFAFILEEPKGTTFTNEEDEDNTLVINKSISRNPFKSLAFGLKQFTKAQRLGVLKVYCYKICGIFGIMGLQTYASSWGINVLGIDEGTMPMLVGTYFIGYLLFSVPTGILADKFGRKKIAFFGLTLMLLGAIALNLTKSIIPIIIIFVIMGTGNATLDVLPMPMATEYAPNKKVMGILVSTAGALGKISTVVSVPLMGVLIEVTNNYNTLFIVTAIMCTIGLVILKSIKLPSELRSEDEN